MSNVFRLALGAGCLLVSAQFAATAEASMLRPLTQLTHPTVLLSDLFDDAGPLADRVLGPSPPPGQSIVVEAPQLAAIARDYGVDWQPGSPDDRATLRRDGMALSRDAVLAALRHALDAAGAPDGDLSLPGFSAPMVPPDAAANVEIERLAYEPDSNRFSAGLVVAGHGMPVLRLSVGGQLQPMQVTPVASHRLLAGDPVGAEDLRLARIPVATLRGPVLRLAAQAEGLVMRRAIAAGQPVPLDDLGRPDVVSRGDHVSIRLTSGDIEMTAAGVALQGGALGDRVRVLNPISRAVVLARVMAPDAVAIDAGSVPLRAGLDASAAAAATGFTP